MILCADRIVTGDGKTVLHGHAVQIENGKIARVAPAAELKAAFPDARVREYGDATILPGLIDMHIHLTTWGYNPDMMYYNDHLIAYNTLHNAQVALRKGVTCVREPGAPSPLSMMHDRVTEKLRYAGKQGFFDIPRILHCNQSIGMTNGHGNQAPEIANAYTRMDEPSGTSDGEWEIRKNIRRQIREGADWIKVLTSHRTATPEYTQEELNAAVDETHRLGRKCCVHAGIEPGLSMAIKAGFDTIEHGSYLTVEQAKEMKARGIAWVPTIIAYTFAYERYKEEYEKTGSMASNSTEGAAIRNFWYFEGAAMAYKNNFKKLYDTGVTICAGTDLVLYGGSIAPMAEELSYMVQYGITPLEAIQIGTSNSARVLDMADQIGQIAPGLEADILVCGGDASQDIGCLHAVREVFLGGKSVHRAR